MKFRKKGVIEAIEYVGQSLEGVSVSDLDKPSEGGWIASDPDNPSDRWFISKEYFNKHYEPVE